MATITWNPEVKLILSDVDETVADLYTEATEEMIKELEEVLETTPIFFITGQGIESVQWRIVDKIRQELRGKILVGHCSGAEVRGYEKSGERREHPFYSVYEQKMSDEQRLKWREVVKALVEEFGLKTVPTSTVAKFLSEMGRDPLTVMYEDRGPQITLEVVNGYDMDEEQRKMVKFEVGETHGHFDMRTKIVDRANQLFVEHQLPVSARMAGVFAIDMVVKGVSKTTAVKYVVESEKVLKSVGLTPAKVRNPEHVEIWGDKFSTIRGGSDRHMCEAMDQKVRAIDFREEDPEEFMAGYNIVVWDGLNWLHEGLLEYLQGRKKE